MVGEVDNLMAAEGEHLPLVEVVAVHRLVEVAEERPQQHNGCRTSSYLVVQQEQGHTMDRSRLGDNLRIHSPLAALVAVAAAAADVVVVVVVVVVVAAAREEQYHRRVHHSLHNYHLCSTWPKDVPMEVDDRERHNHPIPGPAGHAAMGLAHQILQVHPVRLVRRVRLVGDVAMVWHHHRPRGHCCWLQSRRVRPRGEQVVGHLLVLQDCRTTRSSIAMQH